MQRVGKRGARRLERHVDQHFPAEVGDNYTSVRGGRDGLGAYDAAKESIA